MNASEMVRREFSPHFRPMCDLHTVNLTSPREDAGAPDSWEITESRAPAECLPYVGPQSSGGPSFPEVKCHLSLHRVGWMAVHLFKNPVKLTCWRPTRQAFHLDS